MTQRRKSSQKRSRPRPTRTRSKLQVNHDRKGPEAGSVELSYHQRTCKVCKHPRINAIEEEFLGWRSPADIAKQYKIRDRSSIYRHAHATGLYSLRRRDYRLALETILEHGSEVAVTANSIIRAVRACTCLTDDGKWVEPAQRIVVTRLDSLGNAIPIANSVQSGNEAPCP